VKRRKKHKNKSFIKANQHPYSGLVSVWALRILLDLEGWYGLSGFPNSLTSDGRILKTVGLGELEDKDITKSKFVKKLKAQVKQYEIHDTDISGVLANNINKLSELLGLDLASEKILAFAAIIYSHQGLSDVGDTLDNCLTADNVINILAVILEIPVDETRTALSVKSVLSSSGLLSLTRGGTNSLTSKLELMDGLDDVLFEQHTDIMKMLSDYFHISSKGELNSSDYPHKRKDISLIQTYLKSSFNSDVKGINILMYGEPGTGKSELAKVICKNLSVNLYEVSTSDDSGDALSGKKRFSAYQLSQKILEGKKDSVILFDEIEDVFPDDSGFFFFKAKTEEPRKAWINSLLETNKVPSIWICNEISQIDNAFLRRFDYILQLGNPPRLIRERILKKYLKNMPVSDGWIRRVSENPKISPAIVSRAVKVTSNVSTIESLDFESNMERLMGSTLEAMGYSKKVIVGKESDMTYRLDGLNPDVDIAKLVAGLERNPKGRVCLYGPPGTGKTEFGRYISKAIEKPLLIKRASDLLDPYVGMTEKYIARMFGEAMDDEAVLLLDEADSFLRDRNGATRSWEVTQVNELLTQMEMFEGLFICSTNLIEHLDMASLRRFDLKIHFDFLKAEQSWVIFKQVLKDQGVSHLSAKKWMPELSRFDKLTPGDFATVVRKNRLSDSTLTPNDLLIGLASEESFKSIGESRNIGFTATL